MDYATPLKNIWSIEEMDIVDFAIKIRDFKKVYEHEEFLLPFHFNVIDELHANENAHSRILQKLLLYKRKNEYPFLLSFLENFVPDYNSTIEFPLITYNQEYIDLLIEDQKSDFACIIENKIHWATDQAEQITRYIKTVENHGKKNIFVIYLTSDGNKQVSDESFTDDAKKILGYKDENSTGNFILLNYREHILPWLKEEVLNNCTYKDQKMIAGIAQYIDHLEGIFNIREDKKKMNEELMGHIRKNFNIVGATADDFEKLAECQKLLDTFQTELDNLKQEMIQKNPWNQPAREKSFWLANNLKQFFLEDIQKRAAPFSKVDTWQGSVFVLNNWNHNGYTFAIDIAFGEKTGQDVCVSLALRNKNVPYQTICNEMFATIFNKYEWQYQDNWRFKKLYKEITNDNEKMQFIDNILLLLQDLKAL